MDKKKYVKKIVHQIKCSGSKKREIAKQLSVDIENRVEQGETIEDIIFEMGSVEEIADGFNESLSKKEKNKYKITLIFKVAVPILILILLIVAAIQRSIPKTYDIESSKIFDKVQVENEVKKSIELWDAEDYNALQTNAIEEMKASFTKSVMDEIKTKVGVNWGERKTLGNIYMTELVQNGTHYAVCEVTVSYTNISITYRITFDENMKIAGLYLR